MTPDSTNWGGKREGAGRPPSSTVMLKVKLPRVLLADLAASASRHGCTVEEHAAHVLKQHATAPLFGTMKYTEPPR